MKTLDLQSSDGIDTSFPKTGAAAVVAAVKKTLPKTKAGRKAAEEKESVPWTAIPMAATDWVWEAKKPFTQDRTPNFYDVKEVVSALEKAIVKGDGPSAMYWAVEYTRMGMGFVSPILTKLFSIAANTISIAEPNIITYLWNMHCTWKKDTTAGGAEDAVTDNAFKLVLDVVNVLVNAPKTRVVDSTIRTFLRPVPKDAPIIPYEPHVERVHWRTPETPEQSLGLVSAEDEEADEAVGPRPFENADFSATQVPCTTYCDEYAEEGRNQYTLYPLQDGDPPHLKPWVNGLYYALTCIQTMYEAGPTNFDEARFFSLERAVLYYAGLIYQCDEKCKARDRKQDSVYIVWEILDHIMGLDEPVDDDASEAPPATVFSAVCNPYTALKAFFAEKKNGKRERPFLAYALLLITRGPMLPNIERDPLSVTTVDYDLAKVLARNQQEKLAMPRIALDYTTREGHDTSVCDYLNVIQDILDELEADNMDVEKLDPTRDHYFDSGYLLEGARAKAMTKNRKKKLDVSVPYWGFSPSEKTDKKGEMPSSIDKFSLTEFNCVPQHLIYEPEEDEGPPSQPLPWRGEFIPLSPNPEYTTTVAYDMATCMSDVTPLNWGRKEGIFFANFQHPCFERTAVVFVPCSAQEAHTQALVDELKPLFGVPKMGTQRIYLGSTPQRKNKKESWTWDNIEMNEEKGTHVILYPAAHFGFRQPSDVPADLKELSAETITKSLQKRAKAPFFTPELKAVRHQIINVFLFYLALEVPKGSFSTLLMDPTNVGLVRPFFELSAFSNNTFPQIFSKVRHNLQKSLLIGDNEYLSMRWFELVTDMDMESMRVILDRFHAPTARWLPVIDHNLREIRSQWLLWSETFNAQAAKQREKQREQVSAKKALERAAAAENEEEEEGEDEDEGLEEVVVAKPRARKKKKAATKQKEKPTRKRKAAPAKSTKKKTKKKVVVKEEESMSEEEDDQEEEEASQEEEESSEAASASSSLEEEEEEEPTPPPKRKRKKASTTKSTKKKTPAAVAPAVKRKRKSTGSATSAKKKTGTTAAKKKVSVTKRKKK